ncbi:NUDIX domain-containing protein [Patescibacteria group bacterium]|nr:NUDIX domain-containing protein [Patescibacteria group bacterium]
MANQLNIVDENDQIIGQESRTNIHQQGLLHQEVHVWIFKPNGEILFQKRSMSKDTYPGLLDASAGGHVEQGESYQQAALKELTEETGIEAQESDLKVITKMRRQSFDKITKMTNNTFRAVYAYRFDETKDKLVLEEGKALSLEWWPISTILAIPKEQRPKFIPSMFSDWYIKIFHKIKDLL